MNATVGHDHVCKKCGQKAKSVKPQTLLHMLKRPLLSEVKSDIYYFCESKDCPVVYFENETGQYFFKDDIRIRVGLKESESPIQVCYCFDYSVESIEEEINRNGISTAAEDITGKVQAQLCACEVRNPAGRCCLGYVRNVIANAMKINSAT